MKFLIVTHVVHTKSNQQYFAYAPYVHEMNLWLKHADELLIVAPLQEAQLTNIDLAYKHAKIDFTQVSEFSLTSVKTVLKTITYLPLLCCTIFKAMQQADHIHLRCPGNMGLLGCLVQIFFPHKKKTAKYAGNWDPTSKQPWTYRLQKWILSNTFLSRNMQVLVYGEWPNQTKNILPFFTASYSESEILPLNKLFTQAELAKMPVQAQSAEVSAQAESAKMPVEAQSGNMSVRAQSRTTNHPPPINFLFVGTLTPGKQPLYAIQLVEQLHKLGYPVHIDLYGEGVLRNELEKYIQQNQLQNTVVVHGNQTTAVLKKALQQTHFVILASRSEGWPKAIAEGMFWGAVPLASPVSCVPYMLDYGNRGILLQMDLEKDTIAIQSLLNNPEEYQLKRKAAVQWSRAFTLEKMETAIAKLI